uniref:SDR family NAD(P)-dependent oxidoreductase n=1 Tax=Ndongobacter massiliensis TaxID=1871025 RepID=UPI000931F2F8|nr:SDR family NAD(P)-dependent oxidoreductase [Ndongobacter massiliensis]
MIKDYNSKVAVITGAGNGIGKALALGMAERGAKLFLVDIEENDVKAVASEITSKGGQAVALQADVSLPEECDKIFSTAMDEYGRCDILVNNAGVSALGEINQFTEKDLHWVTEVNYYSHVYMMKRFIPQMLEQKSHGQILNVCSIAGIITSHSAPLYFSTKHAAVALSEAVYKWLKKIEADIDIAVFCPGFVQTNMYEADKHRPERFKMEDEAWYQSKTYQTYSAFNKQVIETGKELDEVMPKVFEALGKEQFYILTHDQYDGLIRKQGEFEADMARPIDYSDVQ